MKMRRPERSPTEGMLTFAVTSRSCIAVPSARPDGRRVGVGGTDRSPLWFRASHRFGGAGKANLCAPCKRASGTDAHRLGCRSAGCGENATCFPPTRRPTSAYKAPPMSDILERAARGGLETEYRDAFGHLRSVDTEVLARLLDSLAVEGQEPAQSAPRHRGVGEPH